MAPITDHPQRYKLANELHARPFPALKAPGFAVFLAVKPPKDAATSDRKIARAHLLDLLDRFGADHPHPDATHYFGQLGKYRLKWEQHTEFVTYTMFGEDVSDRAFEPSMFDVFPEDWLRQAPGVRVTSALFRVERLEDKTEIARKVDSWLVRESLSVSSVLDGAAVVAADFRIDQAGHMRFAIFVSEKTGARRIGRVVQRVCEMETYKAMSMLGFARTQNMLTRLGEIDGELTGLVEAMSHEEVPADVTLKDLLSISAELENMLAKSSFRFGATGAYEALVNQRISVLREQRFQGRQTIAEFMLRRFNPSMRTVHSVQSRLRDMAQAATRAGELLRTRVDVERSNQNQKLLESMDRRADQQLRLQTTVEGLSIVAISYYAVNLAAYVAYPFTGVVGMSKGQVLALLTPVVVLSMWAMVRRIRKRFH